MTDNNGYEPLRHFVLWQLQSCSSSGYSAVQSPMSAQNVFNDHRLSKQPQIRGYVSCFCSLPSVRAHLTAYHFASAGSVPGLARLPLGLGAGDRCRAAHQRH